MARQFAGHAGRPVLVRIKIIDRADVVETATSDIVAARGVRASHDPGRTQRYGVYFICGVSIPDNQLTILGSGNEVSPISGPVHGIDLGEVALQCPLRLHQLISRDCLVRLLGYSAD